MRDPITSSQHSTSRKFILILLWIVSAQGFLPTFPSSIKTVYPIGRTRSDKYSQNRGGPTSSSIQQCASHCPVKIALPLKVSSKPYSDSHSSSPSTSPSYLYWKQKIGPSFSASYKRFLSGALSVHENALRLLLFVGIRVGLARILYHLLSETFFHTPRGNEFFRGLVGVLIQTTKTVERFDGGILSVLNIFFRPIELLFATLVKSSVGLPPVLSTLIIDIVTMFVVILLAPIKEELVYRHVLLLLWEPKQKNQITGLVQNPNGSHRFDLSAKITPWAVLSSVMFALAHIDNWVHPLFDADLSQPQDLYYAMQAVGKVVHQVTLAYFVSLRVYTPLYAKYGLAAAIGAHAMWNLNVCFMYVWLTSRILYRFYHLLLTLHERNYGYKQE